MCKPCQKAFRFANPSLDESPFFLMFGKAQDFNPSGQPNSWKVPRTAAALLCATLSVRCSPPTHKSRQDGLCVSSPSLTSD